MLPTFHSLSRRTRAALFAALSLVAAIMASAACSDCDGIVIDGRCVPRCDDASCPGDGRCFEGQCVDACTSSADCSGGGECLRVQTENDFIGRLCIGGTPREATAIGEPCSESADCGVGSGVRCVEGRCTLTCDVHEHCGSTGACTGLATDADGDRVRLCEADGLPRGEGQYGTMCPFGDACDSDGGFRCIGAGPGDIDAYCTGTCQDDGDCPTGRFCAEERTGVQPCTDICGFTPEPAESCIEDALIGPGLPYACGVAWLTTRLCLIRDFCTGCETDADCLGRTNQICAADESGNKICTVRCDPSFDSCPWGNASRCGMWDESVGFPTCSHRFGACQGTGGSCEPCVDQTDCPRGFCARTQFSREKYCVDLSAECACPEGTTQTCAGGGCPLSPSGAPLMCFGGSKFVGTVAEGACIGAAPVGDQAAPDSCWP